MNKSNGIEAISCAGEEPLRRLERPRNGVVVEVRMRAPCKRFTIKGNGTFESPARGFEGDSGKPHSFFPLRTMRVVTRTSADVSVSSLWLADQRVAGGFQGW